MKNDNKQKIERFKETVDKLDLPIALACLVIALTPIWYMFYN
jgi:hypothetical protein